jgi:hypothetical protein
VAITRYVAVVRMILSGLTSIGLAPLFGLDTRADKRGDMKMFFTIFVLCGSESNVEDYFY